MGKNSSKGENGSPGSLKKVNAIGEEVLEGWIGEGGGGLNLYMCWAYVVVMI